jgi:DNA-binding Lrp family transcriptional regulator
MSSSISPSTAAANGAVLDTPVSHHEIRDLTGRFADQLGKGLSYSSSRRPAGAYAAQASRLHSKERADLEGMDSVDQQLLAMLRSNSRTSTAALSKTLRVSRGTVANRIARLEKLGVIAGYTVRFRPDSRLQQVRAWMSIAVECDKTRDVVRALLGEPAMVSLHDTNGRWDLLAELRVVSNAELSQVLARVRRIKGIEKTQTSIHLATFARQEDELALTGR